MCFYYVGSVTEVQLFEDYCRCRSNKMSEGSNKSITKVFVIKVPRPN